MFEYLKPFRQVVVTGPQRSGTTICTHMIAADLGYTAVDETQRVFQGELRNRVNHLSDLDSLKRVLEENGIVVQAPSAAAFCHLLPESVAVVFMIRPLGEILASEQRIGWKGNSYELKLLNQSAGHSGTIKYDNWRWQRPLIKHAFEVKYASLRGHRLWVEADLRKNFGKKQIAPDSSVAT